MYDQSTLSEIIRFARVDAGCAVIDVYPGAGDWTRLFSDVVGPNGRVSSFVPTEIADLKHDQVVGLLFQRRLRGGYGLIFRIHARRGESGTRRLTADAGENVLWNRGFEITGSVVSTARAAGYSR